MCVFFFNKDVLPRLLFFRRKTIGIRHVLCAVPRKMNCVAGAACIQWFVFALEMYCSERNANFVGKICSLCASCAKWTFYLSKSKSFSCGSWCVFFFVSQMFDKLFAMNQFGWFTAVDLGLFVCMWNADNSVVIPPDRNKLENKIVESELSSVILDKWKEAFNYERFVRIDLYFQNENSPCTCVRTYVRNTCGESESESFYCIWKRRAIKNILWKCRNTHCKIFDINNEKRPLNIELVFGCPRRCFFESDLFPRKS